MTLSIIMPLADDEAHWPATVSALKSAPHVSASLYEILLVCAEGSHPTLAHTLGMSEIDTSESEIGTSEKSNPSIRVLYSPKRGRAEQMNYGASHSKGEYLWFVHADTSFSPVSFLRLTHVLQNSPRDLYYFDLSFANDGPSRMALNNWGVWFRSHVLGCPFGDQALLMPRFLFDHIGHYNPQAPYGEDHLLVWQARHKGYGVTPIGATVRTSARKYQQHGWWRITQRHLWLWLKQAYPQWIHTLATRQPKR